MRSLFSRTCLHLHVCLWLLAGLSGTQLFAQSASVSGQVFDSTGAVVSGATVTLLRPSTGVKLTAVTDAKGLFILPPVAPGNYEATVSAPSFAEWRETGVVIEIGQQKVINANLSVGAASTTVSVTDTAPEIQMESSDVGTVAESSLVENIPLDVRNPFQEVNFTPGVTQSNSLNAGTNMSSQDTTNTFYINGTKQGVSDILIDGAPDTVYYDIHAAGAIPNLDSVEQFRIYTSAYAPEFGHTGGGIESFSIKSGTDKFHGGAWEYFRNSALDANGYNADAAGTPKPPFGRNQFGGMVGGPVIIPHVYNGRNRTFFFGSYEELLDSLPGISGALTSGFTTTVPTAAEKTGDFSQSTAWTLYDPTTTTHLGSSGDPASINCPDGTQFSTSSTGYTSPGYYRCKMFGVPASGGPAKYNVIPQSEINPSTAPLLLAMYPAPNRTSTVVGSDENNYFSDATSADKEYGYDLRIDHRFSDKQSIFGHIDFSDHYILYAPVFGPTSYTPTNGNDLLPLRNIIVDHTWVLGPDLIFDHHLSWGHMESHRGSVNPLGTAPFGIPGSAAPGITSTFTPQVESTSNQLGTIGNSEPYERNPSSVWQYAASLSWLKGIHTFKFGADLRLYPDQLFDPQLLTVNTSRTFTGGPSASSPGGTTGNAVAELLMGQATVTSGYAPKVDTRHQYYAFYAEDTAKLTHQLTVNYGLRYSFEGGDVSSGNELNYLDTTDPSAIANQVPANPYVTGSNLVGGVGIVGLNGQSRVLQTPGKLHFEPRLGFTYALNNNTVVHGGAGIFYQPTGSWETDPPAYGFTRQSTSIDAQTNGYQPLFNLSNPFPGGLPAAYGNNPSPLPGNNTGGGPLSIELGQTIEGNLRKQSDAYQEVWSLDVQRILPANFVVTASYAGNEGVHLYGQLQLNQLSDAELALGSALQTTVANPFYGIITDPSSPLSKSTVEEGLLLRAHPQFLNFETLSDGVGHSSYQAGQLTVEHRMSQGLSMLVAYTYSKSIDNIGEAGYSSPSVQDNGCMRCERSIADLDQTNVLRVSTVYELPFGPQKAFLNSGPLRYFAGGWQIGGTGQYNTGQPLQLSSPIEGGLASSLYGMNVLRPELVSGQSITNTSGLPAIKGVYPSFNPNAFMQPGQTAHGVGTADPYMFGNTPRYLSDVRYPPYKDIDVLVQKQTKITERMSATIRFEALNVLNSVVFGAPDSTVTDSNFGYNPHTQENNAREAQISARFTF
jgi:Carboxypeptidase regulatory-like domain